MCIRDRWVGTQNGLARYVGAYRFHRVALPAHHHNIIAIEAVSYTHLDVYKRQQKYLTLTTKFFFAQPSMQSDVQFYVDGLNARCV